MNTIKWYSVVKTLEVAEPCSSDNHSPFTKQSQVLMTQEMPFENTVGKGENAGNILLWGKG